MCGVTGCFRTRPGPQTFDLRSTIERMTTTLAHRGPDDAGVWIDAEVGIALGHRRLSIVDLSPGGHQPMASNDGRFVVSYNGEVFNFEDIRAELQAAGVQFRSTSDTEVIAEACAVWGLTPTLEKMIGMWAIALWDRSRQSLTLVRDRLGIKPMYWLHTGEWLVFGSELKALRAHPGWTPVVNRDAVAAFMRHNYVPAPFTIFEGVHKLEPGTMLRMRAGRPPEIRRYWDLRTVAAAGQRARLPSTEATIDALDDLLSDAVRRRMIADVPLGALLSGGIDSSLVTALMQAQSRDRVKTFSIGFAEQAFDEAPYARAVAQHLGTEHTELRVDGPQAMGVIPRLPEIWDEPFADSSQLPTFLVCQLTRQHVTVVLSGDGGDELFGGYTRYVAGAHLWDAVKTIPRPGRAAVARGLRLGRRRFVSRLAPAGLASKMDRLAKGLEGDQPDDTYRQMLSHFTDPESVVLRSREARGRLWDADSTAVVPAFVERMQYLDTVTYLPDDILTKVDRASMAVALEVRVPLLDHRVVAFSWRLPVEQKLNNGVGKRALRQVLGRYVPAHLFERPKMGFGVPLDDWLRGPLRRWAEPLLDPTRLRQQGLLNPDPILARWNAHTAGQANWGYSLWNVLVLQAWLDANPHVRCV